MGTRLPSWLSLHRQIHQEISRTKVWKYKDTRILLHSHCQAKGSARHLWLFQEMAQHRPRIVCLIGRKNQSAIFCHPCWERRRKISQIAFTYWGCQLSCHRLCFSYQAHQRACLQTEPWWDESPAIQRQDGLWRKDSQPRCLHEWSSQHHRCHLCLWNGCWQEWRRAGRTLWHLRLIGKLRTRGWSCWKRPTPER